jgi:hypothetical protein
MLPPESPPRRGEIPKKEGDMNVRIVLALAILIGLTVTPVVLADE